MSSKILNIVLFCLLSLSIANKANAGLIVGDLYEDSTQSGLYWEYVGSFDLTDGADILQGQTATTFNGLEAALFVFDSLSAGEIALSSNIESDYADIANFLVNHKAFYDTYDGGALGVDGIKEYAEDIFSDINGNTLYDMQGDRSAYVWDRALDKGEFINHVFKAVTTSVPEPSTLAIFALALVGLASRRLKR